MSGALILQTQDNCPPGLVGDWAQERGLELDVLRVDRWEQLPDPSGYAFAVVLGSDASVVGPRRGWVARLLAWLSDADAAGLPVLGICFGAQALAAALGGGARRLPRPERAWTELAPGADPAVPLGPWLGLREDTVVLPVGARELARNQFGTQAFAVKRHMGVQFHPEVTPAILRRWVADKGGAHLLVDVEQRCRAATRGAMTLFDGFLETAATCPSAVG